MTSTAPVTPMLLDYVKIGELEDLSPNNVKPFFVKKLKWRVVDVSPSSFSYSIVFPSQDRWLTSTNRVKARASIQGESGD